MAILDRAIAVFWFVCVMALVFVVAVSLFPFSPVRSVVPGISGQRITEFVPQGWGFFTKDPQEERLKIYRLEGPEVWEEITQNNSAPSNFFGVSRKARVRGLEMGRVFEEQGQDIEPLWRDCRAYVLSECLKEARKFDSSRVYNSYPLQTLCGKIVLVRQAPNPWAYNRQGHENGNPIAIANLEVECRA